MTGWGGDRRYNRGILWEGKELLNKVEKKEVNARRIFRHTNLFSGEIGKFKRKGESFGTLESRVGSQEVGKLKDMHPVE